MEPKEAFRLALQSLWANKLRSVLTLLGVVIGVASVIAVVTLVNGANVYVATKVNKYGRGRVLHLQTACLHHQLRAVRGHAEAAQHHPRRLPRCA